MFKKIDNLYLHSKQVSILFFFFFFLLKFKIMEKSSTVYEYFSTFRGCAQRLKVKDENIADPFTNSSSRIYPRQDVGASVRRCHASIYQ